MDFLPSDTATKLIETLTNAIKGNIGIVLALLGFSLGVGLVFRLLRRFAKVKA